MAGPQAGEPEDCAIFRRHSLALGRSLHSLPRPRAAPIETEIHKLNGQPALVFYDEGAPFAALLLAIADDRIHRVFFHADLDRLHHLGPRNPRS